MYESQDRVPVQTVVENHDTVAHNVTVQAVDGDFVLGEDTETVYPGDDQPMVIYLHPEDVHDGLELFAIPDASADALPEGHLDPSHAAPIPGEVPGTTAVTLFAIVNGVGGAASQLLASTRLAGEGTVPTSRVALAGGLAIAGAIAGSTQLTK